MSILFKDEYGNRPKITVIFVADLLAFSSYQLGIKTHARCVYIYRVKVIKEL